MDDENKNVYFTVESFSENNLMKYFPLIYFFFLTFVNIFNHLRSLFLSLSFSCSPSRLLFHYILFLDLIFTFSMKCHQFLRLERKVFITSRCDDLSSSFLVPLLEGRARRVELSKKKRVHRMCVYDTHLYSTVLIPCNILIY